MQAKGIIASVAFVAVAWLPTTAAQAQQGATTQEQGVQAQAQGDRTALVSLNLKDRALRDVITNIRRIAGVNIIVDAEITDADVVTIELEQVEWRRALDLVAEAADCVVVQLAGNVLKVEKPPRVFISFENQDIQKVIDTIAKISGANIVVAPEVTGTITLRLRNVPWRDALETSAKTLGFVVVEEDRNILRVVPASNMKEDLVTRHFQLRYIRPKSTYVPYITSEYVRDNAQQAQSGTSGQSFKMLDALRAVITPKIGSIEYLEYTNTIVVRDTKPVVDDVARIITSVDLEPAQVFVDVKFVTTTNRDILEAGVSIGDNGWSASIGLGQIPHRLPFDLGSGGWDDKLIVNDTGRGPFANEALNPTGDTVVPDVVYGALNFQQVQATLRLLKRDTNAEIVQAPKLITLDHQEGTIFVGETIRYAQARSEQGQAGGLQLVVEEAPNSPVSTGFQLLVVPHIIPGTDKVMMEIIPKSESLAGTGSSALAPAGFDVFTVGAGTGDGSIALPRIASSTIATKVLLQSAQTAVLGGLVTDNQSETITKVPLLGDIPVLGWMFKHRAVNKTKSNLIVFVTPHIIRSPDEVKANYTRILNERQGAMKEELDRIFGGDPK